MTPTETIAASTGDWIERGADYLNQGNPGQALAMFQGALAVNPRDQLACFNAGVACHALEDYDKAVQYYRQVIQSVPGFAQVHHNLALALAAQKRCQPAIEAYRKALELDSEDFVSAYNLGVLYFELGMLHEAVDMMQIAVRLNPSLAEAFNVLGVIYKEQNRDEEALVCLDQALSIKPDFAEAYVNRGILYQKIGEFERSLDQHRQALICNPQCAPARWLLELSLPMIYDSAEQIEHYRLRFRVNLQRLVASTPLDTDAHKSFALQGVQTTTNFYLQYQCRDDAAPQSEYGRFVHSIMAANFPEWTVEKRMPPLNPDDKIRIGYVSTYMCRHTVGTFLAGWLKHHTRSEFDIHCYHVGKKVDDWTRHIRGLSRHFHHFAGDMRAAASRINADNLHILIYADIGMDPITTQLAALRLAPIQCCHWGHPITTGLPTVDFFLSSDLMEPENADAFYTEKLVRLPSLSLCYEPPDLPRGPKQRAELGIPEDRFVYLSIQSIYKYLPQHDDIYPRIAKAVPRSCFVFIGHHSAAATERFRSRLRTAFSAVELNADDFCIFTKRLSATDFLSLNLAADVVLDSMEWSGGKTTLEALSCGAPVVTLPGRFMRGRHAFAMLKMMEMTDTIARDKSGYCDIAIRLARDPAFLSAVKSRVATNRHKLYNDLIFMAALESFYRSTVHRRSGIA